MKKKKVNSFKVESVLSIWLEREGNLVELKHRSGPLGPKMTEFGMSTNGYGSICCLVDFSLDELLELRNYIDRKIKERMKDSLHNEEKLK